MPKMSTTTFAYYTFRYDYDDTDIRDKIIAYIKREYPKYAIFDEVSEEVKKKHIQGKIGKALSNEQIRKHFIKEFPNTFQKSNYLITKIEKPDEYDSYICKDGNPLINNVFDDQYIAEQVKKREDNKEKFKAKVVKSKSALTFTQKVHAEFKEHYAQDYGAIATYSYPQGMNDDEVIRLQKAKESLLSFILYKLGDIVKVFDDVVLQRMYNGVRNSIEMSNEETAKRSVNFFKNRIEL